MKPVLLIGLGNPLMGNEGIGWHVAQYLAGNNRLPEDVDVLCGGTDLLRCASQMDGRDRVVVIDAFQDDSRPGTVTLFDEPFAALENQQEHAHHLSAVEAMKLLRMTVTASFTLLAISIPAAGMRCELSPSMAVLVPGLMDRVLQELT